MARRRTRYRIVYVRGNEAPKQVDLLVYTKEFARDYAQRAFSDAAIISVAPVARRKPIAAGQAAAWEVDQAVLDDVIRQLGIQWPVSIRRTSHR